MAERRPFAQAADFAACEAMIRTGSLSFHAASLLLPKAMRDAAYALYAFCRIADDQIDLQGGQEHTLARLKSRLDGVYAGAPEDTPVDRRLADVVRAYGVPRLAFDMLLEGLSWDTGARVYHTLDDVEAYAERVAGSVGAMMAALMGVRSLAMGVRACDLGVAMQLTNIARDVGEDARMGRLYLPRTWLVEEGIDPDRWLLSPRFSPALGRVIARLLRRAEDRYRRADEAIARLPLAYRPAIGAARLIYAEIGAAVAARGYDAVTARSRVGGARKSQLAARALVRALRPAGAPLPAVGEAPRALAEALVATAPRPVIAEASDRGLAFVIDLFSRLEQRDRMPTIGDRSALSRGSG